MPERRFDPFAVAVLGGAALCGVVLAAWLAVKLIRDPQPVAAVAPPPVEAPKKPAPRGPEAPKPSQPAPAGTTGKPAGVAPATASVGIPLQPGRTWRYAVRLEPETWRDVTLTYRTVAEGGALVVQTDFRHAGGTTSFRLGTYAAGHPSLAQVRFPGFFMHGAHLPLPLERGRQFAWTYPWQTSDNRVREGRVRRWSAVVGDTELVSVPAGRFDAVRIDARLTYEEGGKVLATVDEILWYAPAARQIVKVARAGRSPDEAGQRIVAELAESR